MRSRVSLVSVYRATEAVETLYRLMGEREKHVNISHRSMPTLAQHRRFVASRPYKAWYLIRTTDVGRRTVGAVYLSKMHEIGVFIFKKERGGGFGESAVRELMRRHASSPRFLANISPSNPGSIRFFDRLGFRHIQNTYELRSEPSTQRRKA